MLTRLRVAWRPAKLLAPASKPPYSGKASAAQKPHTIDLWLRVLPEAALQHSPYHSLAAPKKGLHRTSLFFPLQGPFASGVHSDPESPQAKLRLLMQSEAIVTTTAGRGWTADL